MTLICKCAATGNVCLLREKYLGSGFHVKQIGIQCGVHNLRVDRIQRILAFGYVQPMLLICLSFLFVSRVLIFCYVIKMYIFLRTFRVFGGEDFSTMQSKFKQSNLNTHIRTNISYLQYNFGFVLQFKTASKIMEMY